MLHDHFPPWPNYTQDEVDAVSRVLLSNRVNYWTGCEGRAFETEFAAFSGTKHAIALANGTLALDLALHGLKIGAHNGGTADDEVIVSPRTFLASASAIVNAGAIPVFADVDLDSQVLTPQTVTPHLSPRTRAILCVHFAGWPCDMDGLRKAVAGHTVSLIEDCAQAHGARYKGRPVGGLGDVGAWSFCQDKIMSTGGEGGMVTCNDSDLWSRMWSFKDHGKSWNAIYNRDHPPGFRWVHDSIGTNWRLTEMQAAIGRLQLERLPEWHVRRGNAVARLVETLTAWTGEEGPLRLPRPHCADCDGACTVTEGCSHAWYRLYAFVRPDRLPLGVERDDVISELNRQGIPCMQGSCSEVYLEKAFDIAPGRPKERLPVARQLGETSIMFFTHPGMEDLGVDLEWLEQWGPAPRPSQHGDA